MLNFTVGPVQESKEVLEVGAQPTPYFRNQSFSKIMLENEAMMKELTFSDEESRVVFLTASGTGAMEAAVMNSFTSDDKVLIVNGGSFGKRFVQICQIQQIPYTEITVPMEEPLTKEMLEPYDGRDYTGFLINMHETSIGKLYDINMVSEFCKKNNLFLVVDAVSAFLAEHINLSELGIDIMLTGSQKALAVPPGVSVLVMNKRAVDRAYNLDVRSMYFNLADALKNGERGQTPFTPAVGILLQIHRRLEELCKVGAIAENKRIANLAADFRNKVKDLPFRMFSPSPSNAVTAMMMENGKSAYALFELLESDYGMWICPSGGDLKDKIFRVGHLGALTFDDNDRLVEAMKQALERL